MTADDYADLARHAEAATPVYDWPTADEWAAQLDMTGLFPEHSEAQFAADGAWIAAANPATILRLIRELQQQRHRTAEFQTIAAGFANRAVAAEDRLAAVEVLSWELSPADGPRLRAVLSVASTDTTKETDR